MNAKQYEQDHAARLGVEPNDRIQPRANIAEASEWEITLDDTKQRIDRHEIINSPLGRTAAAAGDVASSKQQQYPII